VATGITGVWFLLYLVIKAKLHLLQCLIKRFECVIVRNAYNCRNYCI